MRRDVGELLQLGIRRFQLSGRLPELFLRPLPIRHVAHDARDQHPVGLLERAKADLDRKLRPVFATGEQLQPSSHWPGPRMSNVSTAVTHVLLTETVGNEDLDRLADKLVTAIAKHLLDLLVHDRNPAPPVDNDDAVGRGLEQRSELRVRNISRHAPYLSADLRRSASPTSAWVSELRSNAAYSSTRCRIAWSSAAPRWRDISRTIAVTSSP